MAKNWNVKINWHPITPTNPQWAGRTLKINHERLRKMEAVLKEWDIWAILLTDEELRALTNARVVREYRISYTTFKNYKKFVDENDYEDLTPLMQRFLSLIYTTKASQKMWLGKMILLWGDSMKWAAWIWERKFPDLNLKHLVESDVNVKWNFSLWQLADEAERQKQLAKQQAIDGDSPKSDASVHQTIQEIPLSTEGWDPQTLQGQWTWSVEGS